MKMPTDIGKMFAFDADAVSLRLDEYGCAEVGLMSCGPVNLNQR